MYLSRLILNPRSRAVRRDLSDCAALHRTIMAAFPAVKANGDARAQLGVLYRVDINPRTSAITLLVQSRERPIWSGLPPGYLLDTGDQPKNPDCKAVDDYYDRLTAGMPLLFRLRANPTRKIDTKTGPDGQRLNGKRVELRGEQTQVEWLRRKGEQAGFRLLTVRTAPDIPDIRTIPGEKLKGRRPPDRGSGAEGEQSRLTMSTILFEGRLLVTDLARFRRAIEGGIGPGKAYGCGLVSVAPTER